MSTEGPTIISREQYDAAVDAWAAARERLETAMTEQRAAEQAVYAAETALVAQEAYPGVAAYAHAAIPAGRCRIGYQCRIHGQGRNDDGPF